MNCSKFKKYSLADLCIIQCFLQDYYNYTSLITLSLDVEKEIQFRVSDF